MNASHVKELGGLGKELETIANRLCEIRDIHKKGYGKPESKWPARISAPMRALNEAAESLDEAVVNIKYAMEEGSPL